MFAYKKFLIVALASGFHVALSSQHHHEQAMRKVSSAQAVIDAVGHDNSQAKSTEPRPPVVPHLMRKAEPAEHAKASVVQTAEKSKKASASSDTSSNKTLEHSTESCTEIALTGAYSAKRLMQCEGKRICKSGDPNDCPAGWKLIAPQSQADWQTVFDSVSSPPASPQFVIDVTKSSGGGSCTSHAMKSGVSACSDWHTEDGQPWWLRDTKYREPNGDYHANCYLSVGFPSDKKDRKAADIHFNDANCNYCSTSYLCQPHSNSALYKECEVEDWSAWGECQCDSFGDGVKGKRTRTRAKTKHEVGAWCTCGTDGKGPVDPSTWNNYAGKEECLLSEEDATCNCPTQWCSEFTCDPTAGWYNKEDQANIMCDQENCAPSAENIAQCCLEACSATITTQCKCVSTTGGNHSECADGKCDVTGGGCKTESDETKSGAMRTAGMPHIVDMAVALIALTISARSLFL